MGVSREQAIEELRRRGVEIPNSTHIQKNITKEMAINELRRRGGEQQKEPTSTWQDVKKQIVPGLIEGGLGIGNLIQAPVGVPWWAARKAGIPLPEMPMVSELGASGLKELGYDLEENRPKTLPGKIVREAVGFAVPGGPASKILGKAGTKVAQYAPKSGKYIEKFSEFAGPKKTISKEGLRSIGAGAATGATVGALQHGLGEGKDAQVTANILGGIGVPALLGATKGLKSRRGQGAIEDFLEAKMSPEERVKAIENIEKYNPEQFVEGYKPTTAEIAESPTLAAYERSLMGQTGSPEFSKISQRTREQNEAILDKINGLVPESYNAEQAQDFVRNYYDDFTQTLVNVEEMAGRDAANRVLQEFTRRATPQEAGKQIQRTVFEKHLEPLKEERRKEAAKNYAAVEESGERFSPNESLFFIDKKLKNARGPIESKLLEFKKMLQTKDNEFIAKEGKAERVNPRIGELAAAQQAVKQELSSVKPGSPMSSMLSELNEKLERDMAQFLPKKEAAKKYAEQSKPISQIEKHPTIGKDVKTNILKEFKTPSSNVPKKYIEGDSSVKYAEDLKPYIQNDKDAIETIEGYVDSSIINNALNTETGHINVNQLNNWKKSHPGAFVLYPKLNKKIGTVSSAQKHYTDTVEKNAKKIKEFEKSAAGKFLKKDADNVAKSVLGSTNSEKEIENVVSLLNQDKNNVALPGFQRSIAKHISNMRTLGEGATNVSIKKYNSFIRDKEKALSKVFDENQMETLHKIDESLMARNKKYTIGKELGSPTAPKFYTMFDLANLGKVKGFGKFANKAIELGLNKIAEYKKGKHDELFVKMLMEPEFAKLMFTNIKNKKPSEVNKMINEYLKNNTLKNIEKINREIYSERD